MLTFQFCLYSPEPRFVVIWYGVVSFYSSMYMCMNRGREGGRGERREGWRDGRREREKGGGGGGRRERAV